MANHTFSFPAAASGRNVSVYNAAGAVVATDTLGTSSDFVVLEVDLPWGQFYTAKTTGSETEYTAQGEVQEIAASSGGVGAAETDPSLRGTLYLKASCVDADASQERWADGTGAPLTFVLDTDMQGDSPIPAWATENNGVYSITDQGAFVAQIAGIGSVTYDVVPESVYIDLLGPPTGISGANWGWMSSGGDDTPDGFEVGTTTQLPFGRKETPMFGLSRTDLPVSLAGCVCDNYGPLTDNPLVSLEVRLSITKYGSGVRYAEADLA